MSRIILLDSGPLSYVLTPAANPRNKQCSLWLESLLLGGVNVQVPELCDYEVRRGFLRVVGSHKKTDHERALHRSYVEALNALISALGYVPITTAAMLKASEFWADVRNRGFPTARDEALDGDMILCAQAAVLTDEGHTVMIATENDKHLSLLVQADDWRNISA